MKTRLNYSFVIIFLISLPLQAQNSKELWQELEVAMSGETLEAQEFQAFQSEIQQSNKKPINDFVEQSISTGMAGIQKQQTPKTTKPKRSRKRGSGFKVEAPARANQTIFSKKTFKAPRQRSR